MVMTDSNRLDYLQSTFEENIDIWDISSVDVHWLVDALSIFEYSLND